MLYKHVKTKPNASRYIEALIKQDFQAEHKQDIYKAIIKQLVADDAILIEIGVRLKELASKPTEIKNGDTSLVINSDWGA